MRSVFVFLVALLGSIQNVAPPSPEKIDSKTLRLVLARGEYGPPAKIFPKETPAIETRWKGNGLAAGDKIQSVWTAVDVGSLAPKETEVTRASVIAYKSDEDGAFILHRPKEGWPRGEYRCDIYINGKLADTASFSIADDVVVEVGRQSN